MLIYNCLLVACFGHNGVHALHGGILNSNLTNEISLITWCISRCSITHCMSDTAVNIHFDTIPST